MSSASKSSLFLKSTGEEAWKKAEKINGEFFILMYGGLVTQIIKDYEDLSKVNQQLEKIGYNIGQRLIEDFLIKSNLATLNGKCKDFREISEVISKVAFKMFLNITPTVTEWSEAGDEFSLVLEENPLIEYVELPETYQKGGLQYCSVIPGILKGALEMIRIQVETTITKCSLRNRGDHTQIRVKLLQIMEAEHPPADF